MSTRVRDRRATINSRTERPPAQPAAVARAHRAPRSRTIRRRHPRHTPTAASTRRRLIGIFVAIGLVFMAIGARLVDVQARNRQHYQQLGIDQRVHQVTIVPERGSIFDRNGNDLAVSVARSTIWADPRHVKDPNAAAAALAPIVGEDVTALAIRLGQKDRSFVYVARKLEHDAVARVKALDLPGLGVIPENKRYYPAGLLAAPLLGFVGIDNNGLAGLEAGADVTLAGKSGQMEVEQDPKGRELPEGERQIVAPERGADLVLTIDQSLQYEVERVLAEAVEAEQANGGTAVIADTRTGDVLAMATVVGPTSATPARAANATEPNRPLTDVFEPGSTNKVVTIAAALAAGVVSPTTVLQVPSRIVVDGQEYKDVSAHPTSMTVADIVRESSNVGTILIARMLGAERFDAALRNFGFGTGTGLGFPGEAEGILLPLDQYNATSMASMPIGSGIAVTAMQMLDVYLTIANGGIARAPRLVTATVDSEGNRQEVPLGATRTVVSPTTAAQMSTMLEAVVADGTGTKAQIPGYRVAGKTGTARKPPYLKPPYKYVTSFAGFAPANDPHLAAIVVLDEPQKGNISGGQLSAPVFARLMQYALAVERVPAST